ncbi:MAG: hypothetical protein JJ992_05995 [Planctomycetes bacterium]|nr:hypothetical protein [Planctomycetota bacterium]
MSRYFDRLAQRTGIVPRLRSATVGTVATPHLSKARGEATQAIEDSLSASSPEGSVTSRSERIEDSPVDVARPVAALPEHTADAIGAAPLRVTYAKAERESSFDEPRSAAESLIETDHAYDSQQRVESGDGATSQSAPVFETKRESIEVSPGIPLSATSIASRANSNLPQVGLSEPDTRDLEAGTMPKPPTAALQPERPSTRDVRKSESETPDESVGLTRSESAAPSASTAVGLRHGDARRSVTTEMPPQVARVPESAVSLSSPTIDRRSAEDRPIRIVRPVLPDRSANENRDAGDTAVRIGSLTMEIHAQQQPAAPPAPSCRPAREPRGSKSPEVSLSRFYLRGI